MPVNLDEHKVYVDSHKMEMVPLSVALKAIKEASSPDVEKYSKDFENAIIELRNSINDIKLDD